MSTYHIEHHGSSGTWRPTRHAPQADLQAALDLANGIKAAGYGVRIVREDGEVVVDAPWQVEVPAVGEQVLAILREQRKSLPWMPPVMTEEEAKRHYPVIDNDADCIAHGMEI